MKFFSYLSIFLCSGCFLISSIDDHPNDKKGDTYNVNEGDWNIIPPLVPTINDAGTNVDSSGDVIDSSFLIDSGPICIYQPDKHNICESWTTKPNEYHCNVKNSSLTVNCTFRSGYDGSVQIYCCP